MYVCICNAITDKQIRAAAESGKRDLWRLQAELGVATNCGSCADVAQEILAEFSGPQPNHRGSQLAGDVGGERTRRPAPSPVVYEPALGDALPAPA